jgi:hypothetical protein
VPEASEHLLDYTAEKLYWDKEVRSSHFKYWEQSRPSKRFNYKESPTFFQKGVSKATPDDPSFDQSCTDYILLAMAGVA